MNHWYFIWFQRFFFSVPESRFRWLLWKLWRKYLSWLFLMAEKREQVILQYEIVLKNSFDKVKCKTSPSLLALLWTDKHWILPRTEHYFYTIEPCRGFLTEESRWIASVFKNIFSQKIITLKRQLNWMHENL